MSIPYDKKTPHRFDVVGSFLRPARLKQARIDWKDGRISAAELKAIEDDSFLMRFNSAVSPCVVTPVEGGAYTYMILPLRNV